MKKSTSNKITIGIIIFIIFYFASSLGLAQSYNEERLKIKEDDKEQKIKSDNRDIIPLQKDKIITITQEQEGEYIIQKLGENYSGNLTVNGESIFFSNKVNLKENDLVMLTNVSKRGNSGMQLVPIKN